MAKYKLTDEERAAAEVYLRQRLDAELSMSNNLAYYFSEAVRRICEILVKYGVKTDALMSGNIPTAARDAINSVVEWLVAEIVDATVLLAADEREDKDWFVSFLGREYENGYTFRERLDQYSSRFAEQVQMAFAALVLSGKVTRNYAKTIANALDDIYNAPFVVSARKENAVYFSPDGIGQGVPLPMSKAITALARQEISNAWMEWAYEEAKGKKAIGYFVFRGSSYPCDACDEEASHFHPIEEGMCLPEHNNCCCCAAWVYG